ncbi:MAG: HD domain-containing protein [Candidatus Latescibacteria bacterium]|nr:HD domain-containing protein [Candidatus Latescibacterota bacterium]
MPTAIEIPRLISVMLELDKLKGVSRQSLVLGGLRRENSAEHSWHTATALMLLSQVCGHEVDMLKLLKMALVHDICEIDYGDTSIYASDRSEKSGQESACMNRIRDMCPELMDEFRELWLEYEGQVTHESRLLKVADRILPLILNVESQGKSWQEQGIRRSQVLAVNQTVKEVMPELYIWIEKQVDAAVQRGWLLDS